MSRTTSFRDLIGIVPQLKGKTERELISPKMDWEMKNILDQLGFSVHRGVDYYPCKHRDLKGNVGVGYVAVGYISNSKAYLKSRLCDPIERIVSEYLHGDMSLCMELCRMQGIRFSLKEIMEDEPLTDDEYPDNWIEDDYERVEEYIKYLELQKRLIRHGVDNDNGCDL
jgi:hypothetical protein